MAGRPKRRARRNRARRNPFPRLATPPVGSQVILAYFKKRFKTLVPGGSAAGGDPRSPLVMSQAQLIAIGENDIEDDVVLVFRLRDGTLIQSFEPGRGVETLWNDLCVAKPDIFHEGVVAVVSVPKNPPPRPPRREYTQADMDKWMDDLSLQRSRANPARARRNYTPDSMMPLDTPERASDYLRHRYGLVGALDVAERYAEDRPRNRRFWGAVMRELDGDSGDDEVYWNPKKKVVASHQTDRQLLSPPAGNTYEDILVNWYEDDLVPRYGEVKGRKVSRKQARKQVMNHEFLIGLMQQVARPGDTIGSLGAGMCHEAALAPEFRWTCLEYQPNLVDLSRQRNKYLNLDAKAEVWSAFPGDVEQCQHQSCKHLLNNLGKVPDVDVLYLKHFCGGGTDGALFTAAHKEKKPIIVAMTCCGDRYPGLSHAVLAPNTSFSSYQFLAKKSQDRRTEGGLNAVQEIDDLRERFLKKHGYQVFRGWQTNSRGERTPSGSWLIAIPPGRPQPPRVRQNRGRRG